MKQIFRAFILFVIVVLGIFLGLFTLVDRTPYQQMDFYAEMSNRLDSLERHLSRDSIQDYLSAGWSKISITPRDTLPLAGYGGRNPKKFQAIHDSIFVRTVVFKSGVNKAAVISADLLIFHPIVTQKIASALPNGWSMDEIYLTTTHSHSSLGGWAPGFLGEAISGEFIDSIPDFIARKVVEGIKLAERRCQKSEIAYVESDLGNLVYNRLVHEKGITDPWLKSIMIRHPDHQGILNFYAAHATCLSSQYHELSGDFPGYLNHHLEKDTIYDFSLYGAGAVGSMGPVTLGEEYDRARQLAEQIKSQVEMLSMVGVPPISIQEFRSFHLKVPLRLPYAKITENWALRPYLFHKIAGDYPADISVLQLGKTILIGMPCDFSGELAMPLYQRARQLDLNLIITSFNGDYIGYVVKDEWYDLNKYESRSMSWYGPDNGSYLSEIIKRILEILA